MLFMSSLLYPSSSHEEQIIMFLSSARVLLDCKLRSYRKVIRRSINTLAVKVTSIDIRGYFLANMFSDVFFHMALTINQGPGHANTPKWHSTIMKWRSAEHNNYGPSAIYLMLQLKLKEVLWMFYAIHTNV